MYVMASSRPTTGGTSANALPVDAERLEAVFRKVASAKKLPGWPGKPPKEVRANVDDEAGTASGEATN
jgi:hypothetical protein